MTAKLAEIELIEKIDKLIKEHDELLGRVLATRTELVYKRSRLVALLAEFSSEQEEN